MSAETIFLACFAFGALFTVASVVLGFASSAVGGSGSDLGQVDVGGHEVGGHDFSAAHGADAGHGAEAGSGQGDGAGPAHHAPGKHAGLRSLPVFNVTSAVAFLTWFGAAGYSALRLLGWPLAAALASALVAGGLGALLVAFFLSRMRAAESVMDPRDYRLEGTIGRVTVSIPPRGVGEVVFTRAGVRRSEAARSQDGGAIPYGSEVVIVDYSRGVATVQLREESAGLVEPDVLDSGIRLADTGPEDRRGGVSHG